jgi:hypothetical protein
MMASDVLDHAGGAGGLVMGEGGAVGLLGQVPALFAPNEAAARRTLEFFAVTIRNPNTRKAYAHGCARRPNFDHPCRLNIDQGWKSTSVEANCG